MAAALRLQNRRGRGIHSLLLFESLQHLSRESRSPLRSPLTSKVGACKKMRSLSLCLNYFDPDPIQNCKERYSVPESWDIRFHATCVASHPHRLFSKAKAHDEASSIGELEQLCQALRTHIQSNQLRLSFACDMADIEIAEEVLRPLSQLPHRRECSILLGFQHSPTDTEHIPLLQKLAKKTCYLANQSLHPSNFRLHRPATRYPAPGPVLYSTGDSLRPSLESQHARLYFHPIPLLQTAHLPLRVLPFCAGMLSYLLPFPLPCPKTQYLRMLEQAHSFLLNVYLLALPTLSLPCK